MLHGVASHRPIHHRLIHRRLIHRAVVIALGATAAMVGALLVPAPDPLPTSAPPAPAASDAADCLARSAIVPVDAAADADAGVVREAAVRSLQHALLLAAPDGIGGAALRFDAAGIAGLDVREAQPGSAAAHLPAAIAGLPPQLRAAVDAADVAVVGPAERSIAALCAGLDEALAAGADPLVSAGIDHDRATLRLGVERSSPAAGGIGTDAIPSAGSGDVVAADAGALAALGLDLADLPVDLVADVADTPVSRLDDRDGVGGGTALRVAGTACSAGFSVRGPDGAPALMSAGHCTHPDGTDGAAVTNGFGAFGCALGADRPLGIVSENRLATTAAIDTMLVRTASAAPTMWLGARCSGTQEVPVHGSALVGPGGSVGFSGTRSGEQYATRTAEPVQCYDFGYWACGVLRAGSSSATYACHQGDSGGPAFRHREGGGVLALGVITASGFDLGINRCSWTDMAVALQHSRAALMTPASATMAPPTRIAGADRFETSAAISRSGYPQGSSTVYVASGEGFPDALSAGAAAAQQRAPLLLTARDALPETVRREIVRLAPTTIVVVGGEPSVSAAVASRLASIAPVERLGGADRFATSALIARHAFSDGAATAFVATGRDFPDALAAGPVAALRDAPVLLVDDRPPAASSVATATGALAALSVTRVVVVGSQASVSDAVAAQLAAGRTLERIAGADRFATAARLNAAFSPRPASLYLASGEGFPDALAASALAGAQQRPLYLTRSWCLMEVVRLEHERLGRPAVVLLGGTPTLSDRVARYELCG